MRPVRSPSLPAAALRVRRPRVNEENRTPCWVGHDHPPLHPAPSTMCGQFAPTCIREVLTLRLPRCERGALPLSYGCVDERAGGRARTGSGGIKSPGPVPSGATSDWSARPVSNEAFRCIRAASSPADSGPWMHRVDTGHFGSPTSGVSCRRSALSYVSVVVMGGFDPPPRVFQRALSQLSYTTMGPAPGLEPGSTGLQSQRPSRWARPALLSCDEITPRRLGAVLHRRPRGAAAGRNGVLRRRYRVQLRRVAGRVCAVLGNDELQPIRVASMHLLSGGSGGRCRTLISRTKTLRLAIGRLPSGG